MARVNYNDKTRRVLKDLFGHVEGVEKYNQFTQQRKDFLGIIDFQCVHKKGILGCQSTGSNGRSTHHKTIMSEPGTLTWLDGPTRKLWLMTWKKKLIKRGGTKFTYLFTVDSYSLVDGEVVCERGINVEHKKSVNTLD